MKLNKDYILDFKSRFTYNSNAIEGNTLSLPETVSIIKEEYLPSSEKGKSLREIYEVVNHGEAVNFILNNQNDDLDSFFIKALHGVLMDRLIHDRGKFKTTDNIIIGADFETTPASKIEEVMKQYFDNLNYQLENLKDVDQLFVILAESHIKFERIHPFSDGNGRAGRLLINKILLSKNQSPIVIANNEKKEYYNMLAEQDIKGLSNKFKELSQKEKERIKKYEKTTTKGIEI